MLEHDKDMLPINNKMRKFFLQPVTVAKTPVACFDLGPSIYLVNVSSIVLCR